MKSLSACRAAALPRDDEVAGSFSFVEVAEEKNFRWDCTASVSKSRYMYVY
jgi:hypothetical protein